jgi:hypothetical protein
MRCYKVSAEVTTTGGEDGGSVEKTVVQYAGTQADARLVRDEFVDKYDIKKKDVTIEDAEIPTAKSELLEFVNGILKDDE